MKSVHVLVAWLAGTMLGVAGPAVAQKKYDPGVSDTEIKIGQTMPYSGPASAYGTIGKAEERLLPDDQRARAASMAARSR